MKREISSPLGAISALAIFAPPLGAGLFLLAVAPITQHPPAFFAFLIASLLLAAWIFQATRSLAYSGLILTLGTLLQKACLVPERAVWLTPHGICFTPGFVASLQLALMALSGLELRRGERLRAAILFFSVALTIFTPQAMPVLCLAIAIGASTAWNRIPLLHRLRERAFLLTGLALLLIGQAWRHPPYPLGHEEADRFRRAAGITGATYGTLVFENNISQVRVESPTELARVETFYRRENLPFDRSHGFDLRALAEKRPEWVLGFEEKGSDRWAESWVPIERADDAARFYLTRGLPILAELRLREITLTRPEEKEPAILLAQILLASGDFASARQWLHSLDERKFDDHRVAEVRFALWQQQHGLIQAQRFYWND